MVLGSQILRQWEKIDYVGLVLCKEWKRTNKKSERLKPQVGLKRKRFAKFDNKVKNDIQN